MGGIVYGRRTDPLTSEPVPVSRQYSYTAHGGEMGGGGVGTLARAARTVDTQGGWGVWGGGTCKQYINKINWAEFGVMTHWD